MLFLRPLAIDGDGLAHGSRAIYDGFLAGMDPKHPLAAMVLRAIYLPLQAAALKRVTLSAFVVVSSLSGVGTFLLLACSIFPRFIRAWSVSLLCALGVVVSYGVLSRASTIEVYAPSLLLDVALVAFCLKVPFTGDRDAVAASSLLVLAVGFHVTNLLIIPGVIALVIGRAPRERIVRALFWGGATFLLGVGAVLCLLWLRPTQAHWPPDLDLILPHSDPQPSFGLGGHLSRSVYGFARTLAFRPYHRELRAVRALAYVVLVGGAFLLTAHLGRKGFLAHPGKNGRLLLTLVILATPFLFVGVCYYPSDPERWLFLMPVVWLLVGLAWDQPDSAPERRATAWQRTVLLAAIVLALMTYNAAALLPDALASRYLTGLKELSQLTTADDLVISPSGINGRINEFYLDRPIQAENLTVMALVKQHGGDQRGLQTDMADRVDRALRDGRRVFVFDLIGAGHEKQRGYPWAHVEHDYGPDTFLSVLERYRHDIVIRPGRRHVGIIRLG